MSVWIWTAQLCYTKEFQLNKKDVSNTLTLGNFVTSPKLSNTEPTGVSGDALHVVQQLCVWADDGGLMHRYRAVQPEAVECVCVFSQKAKQTLMLWALREISGNFTLYHLILRRVWKNRALCKFLNLWNKGKFPLWVPLKKIFKKSIHTCLLL